MIQKTRKGYNYFLKLSLLTAFCFSSIRPAIGSEVVITPLTLKTHVVQLRQDANKIYRIQNTVDISRGPKNEVWFAKKIIFEEGAKIKVGTNKLRINADEIAYEGNEDNPILIYSFDGNEAPPKAKNGSHGKAGITPSGDGRTGATGERGKNGGNGAPGKSADLVALIVSKVSHPFRVHIPGQPGGAAGNGGNGGNGDEGNRGARASDGPAYCKSGGKNGGNGGNGGKGGNAGVGGPAGDGGYLLVVSPDAAKVSLSGSAAPRGADGIPGNGGAAAEGGGGGKGSTYCGGGKGGSNGKAGARGVIPKNPHPTTGQPPLPF